MNTISNISDGLKDGHRGASVVIISANVSNQGKGSTLTAILTFTNPTSEELVGEVPSNPFIYVNQDRGKEVHLADMQPTALADADFFNTYDDVTEDVKTYRTDNNLCYTIYHSIWHFATSSFEPLFLQKTLT